MIPLAAAIRAQIDRLDSLPYGQIFSDIAGTEWQRINHPAEKPYHVTAQWRSLDGYETQCSANVLDAHGFARLGDVRKVVVAAPPVERGPAIEVSQG